MRALVLIFDTGYKPNGTLDKGHEDMSKQSLGKVLAVVVAILILIQTRSAEKTLTKQSYSSKFVQGGKTSVPSVTWGASRIHQS